MYVLCPDYTGSILTCCIVVSLTAAATDMTRCLCFSIRGDSSSNTVGTLSGFTAIIIVSHFAGISAFSAQASTFSSLYNTMEIKHKIHI